MSSPMVIQHFPRGGTVYAYGDKVPKEGDVLSRSGNRWKVTSVAEHHGRISVTLKALDYAILDPLADGGA